MVMMMMMICAGNVLLVVVGSLVSDYCLDGAQSRCSKIMPMSPVNYQQFTFIIEVAVAIPFIVKHIGEL